MALVHADAHADVVGPPLFRLDRQLGVGDQGADHADHVGGAIREDAVRHRGVGDLAGNEDGHVDDLLDGGRGLHVVGGRHVPRAHVGDLQTIAQARVVAAADADEGHVRRQRLADAGELVDGEPVVPPVPVQPDPNADRIVGTGELAARLDDLQHETDAVLPASPVAVLPPVEPRRQELGDQIAMRAVDLGRVKARLLGPPDAVGKGRHQVGDLLFGQFVRDDGVERLGHRRGSEGGLQTVAMHARPGVVDLAEDLRPLIVDHLGALPQAGDAYFVEELDALRRRRIGETHVEVAAVLPLPPSRPKGKNSSFPRNGCR